MTWFSWRLTSAPGADGKLKYGDAIQKICGNTSDGLESLPKEMELEPVLPAAEFPENQRFTKLVWQALPQVMFPN